MKKLLTLIPLMMLGCGSTNPTPEVVIEQTPAPPSAVRVASSISCEGAVEVGTPQQVQNGTALTVVGRYQAVVYSNGDCFASGSVNDASNQSADSYYYPYNSDNWQIAPLALGLDVLPPSNYGYWTLSLDRTTYRLQMQYVDQDLTSNGLTDPYGTVFPASDCQISTFDH